MLACDRPRSVRAAGGERRLNRSMLALVERIELVDRLVAGRPDRRAGEGAAGALRHLLDERELRDPVDDVVETVVRAHPLRGQRTPVAARPPAPERARQAGGEP